MQRPPDLRAEVSASGRTNETLFVSLLRLSHKVKTGDILEVHILDNYALNKTTGERYELRPIGDVLPIIEAGDVFKYAKQVGMVK